MNRSDFLKQLALIYGFSQLNFLSACSLSQPSFEEFFTDDNLQFCLALQLIILPNDGVGPSASAVQAHKYLFWALADKRRDQEINQYLVSGFRKTQKVVSEAYQQRFIDLSQQQQIQIVEEISTENWGERWLASVITLCLEAVLSDPIYGGNSEQIGWKWLGHQPGFPRPTEANKYDNLLSLHSQ